MSSEGRFTLLKARLGKVTSGGTIKLSVSERVRDQRMEPANEIYSIEKCFGDWRGPRRFHKALHQQVSVTRRAQPETANGEGGLQGEEKTLPVKHC